MDAINNNFMPLVSPLPLPVQNLKQPFTDSNTKQWQFEPSVLLWRVAVFVPTVLASVALLLAMLGWFENGGFNFVEIFLIGLISFNFFWITLTVATVLCGIVSLLYFKKNKQIKTNGGKENVALLLPIYNEDTANVLGNAFAILQELLATNSGHTYTMFVLSDSTDEKIAASEVASIKHLREKFQLQKFLYYRRRENNVDRKVGNIGQWVANWGGAYSAMLVLDADSLMSGEAIKKLSDGLAADSSAGLIQSFPQVIGASTLFARAQQFASSIYGAVLAQGLACWSGREGNYWGHNAILRTRAFSQCAGLPKFGDKLILSHDFIEASLLRRAGWGVKFFCGIKGSYEETPATLIDYIVRDRRWCYGNLQHLRMLAMRSTSGFHFVSRFHLLHGAISYLLSPLWFCLLVVWALVGNGPENSVLNYFSENNPYFPTWPEMGQGWHLLVLLLTYSMLLAPKFLGAASMRAFGIRIKDVGGGVNFALSFVLEIILSIAYAPILMVQQMLAVCGSLFGKQQTWGVAKRTASIFKMKTYLSYHFLETASGLCLLAGIVFGVVTIWLVPIAISLACAVPLSILSGYPIGNNNIFSLATPEVFNEPQIIKTAKQWRSQVKQLGEGV